MDILLITPASAQSKGGNRATADRWARHLRRYDHRVRVATAYEGEASDLLLALHAWRSAEAIAAFRERFPDRPLVVALTGTDIYRFQESHPETTEASLAKADALIGLHARVAEDIPAQHRNKLHTVLQSAAPAARRTPLKRHFELALIANLRPEKDPLRPALAARLLPEGSRIRITHLGGGHTEEWAEAARAEAGANPRYRWQGERPHDEVRKVLARSQGLVVPSLMEGGANVVSEALAADTPVIASAIPGNRGLLGDDYPGYFPPGDPEALAELMGRMERDPGFAEGLRHRCAGLAPLVRPEREAETLNAVIAAAGCQVGPARPPG